METIVESTKIVKLDLSLTQKELIPDDKYTIEEFNHGLKTKTQTIVRDCISGHFRQKNYLLYLHHAWGGHYGVVISPDIFWQIFLTEIAGHIKDNSEYYRKLFTSSEKKVEITVPTGDPQLIDLKLIESELRKLVPTDINLFMPEFTTSTESSLMAFKAAFADAMTPYYNYSMYLCGIPKIRIDGTVEDWQKMCTSVDELKKIIDKDEKIVSYLSKVKALFEKICNTPNTDIEFWKDIFTLKKCGSGSQVEVHGWITDLFIKIPSVRYGENFSSCVSKVPYTFLNTGQKFELIYGLFGSSMEEEFLVPEFGYLISEETA